VPTIFTVRGTVTDGTSGGALPNIQITITDGQNVGKFGRTDNAGTYLIGGVVAGTMTLSASASGYQTSTKSATVSTDTVLDWVLARVIPTTTTSSSTTSTSSVTTTTVQSTIPTTTVPPTTTPTTVPGAPPPPIQVSPSNGAVFNIFPRTTTLTWTSVTGAARYGLEYEYCQPPACVEGSTAAYPPQTLSTTTFTFNFVGAQPGRWRVWSIGPTGVAGPKSGWWIFYYTI